MRAMGCGHRRDGPCLERLEPRLLLDAIREPYLQAVTQDSIYVLLETDSQAPATVEYGRTAAYGLEAATASVESSAPGKYVHNIRPAGLAAATEYHYRVRQGTTTSADYAFRTLVPPGEPFRFAWMADSRTGLEVHDAIASGIAAARPLLSIYGGDLCNDPSWATWDLEFFRPVEQALIAEVPFFYTPGNHEGWNDLSRAFTQAPTAEAEARGYYAFDCGDLHVLVLNTEVPRDQGSDQWDFAQADLAASTARWKIVACHIPAYTSWRPDPAIRAMTAAIFEPCGVDVVLAGHDHYYQHNLVNGIHHLVLGSAGAGLMIPTIMPCTVYAQETYSYAVFDVSPGRLRMTAYNEVGTTIEVVDLAKNLPPSAIGESYSVAEDHTLAVAAPGVLGGDVDPDGDPLIARLVQGPSRGRLTLHPDGAFIYTPDADWFGQDGFTYEAFDGKLAGGPAAVTIAVAAVPDVPRVQPQALRIPRNIASGAVVGRVIAFDPDPGERLTFTIVRGNFRCAFLIHPVTGELRVGRRASLDCQAIGTFRLTIRVRDGQGLIADTTVTISLYDLLDPLPAAPRRPPRPPSPPR